MFFRKFQGDFLVDFKILVDADSCPSAVRKIIQKTAISNSVSLVFAANHEIAFDFESDLFSFVLCPKEQDSADNYIVENSNVSDIIVTRDLPLAKRLLDKGCSVINDRGTVFDEKKLSYMLEERNLSLQMTALGIRPGNISTGFEKKDIKKFAESFSSLVLKKNKCSR